MAAKRRRSGKAKRAPGEPRSRVGRAKVAREAAQKAAEAAADPCGHGAELAELRSRIDALTAERDRLRAERDTHVAEIGRLRSRRVAKPGVKAEADTEAGGASASAALRVTPDADLYSNEALALVRTILVSALTEATGRLEAGGVSRRTRLLGRLLDRVPVPPARTELERVSRTLFRGFRSPDASFARRVTALPLPLEIRSGSPHHKLVASGDPDCRMTLPSSASDQAGGEAMAARFRRVFL